MLTIAFELNLTWNLSLRHYTSATRFVRLKGMVTREELLDPAEAAEILEDTEVKGRCRLTVFVYSVPVCVIEGGGGAGGTHIRVLLLLTLPCC